MEDNFDYMYAWRVAAPYTQFYIARFGSKSICQNQEQIIIPIIKIVPAKEWITEAERS